MNPSLARMRRRSVSALRCQAASASSSLWGLGRILTVLGEGVGSNVTPNAALSALPLGLLVRGPAVWVRRCEGWQGLHLPRGDVRSMPRGQLEDGHTGC